MKRIIEIALIVAILTGCNNNTIKLGLSDDFIGMGGSAVFIDTSWYINNDDYYEFEGKLFPADIIKLSNNQDIKVGDVFISENNNQFVLYRLFNKYTNSQTTWQNITFTNANNYNHINGFYNINLSEIKVKPINRSSDLKKIELFSKPINITYKIKKNAIIKDNPNVYLKDIIATPTILGHTIFNRNNHADEKGVFKNFVFFQMYDNKPADELIYNMTKTLTDINIVDILELNLKEKYIDNGDFIELEANTISCKDYYRPMPTDKLEMNDEIKTCQDITYKMISKAISETLNTSFKLQNINFPNIIKLGELNQKTGRIEIDGEETTNTIKISKNAIITDLYGNELTFNDLIRSKKAFQLSIYDIEKDENDIITKIIDCSFDKVYNIYNELIK